MLHSMQLCLGDATGVSSGDRVLAVVPMFHVCAWGLPWACMLVGADLILTDRFLQPDAVARLITGERPTFGGAVPTIWTGLLQYVDKVPTDLSSFRMVLVGGSACPPALMKAFEERHKMRIVHAWGMTETSPLGSVAVVKEGLDEETAWKLRITQGRLSPFVEAKLLGPDGAEVPWDGVTSGELCVRGPWVTGSYYPENDPEKFVDGWLRTGDVGTLTPDGYLTLTDRAKDVIKSGGEWISSVLLENLLMAHPTVLEACVVGVPDDKWGERPLACVVPKPDQQVSFAQLRAFLGEKVAKWQLPERWSQIASVPKTSVGKFDKKVLRADYAANKLEVTIVD
jgi:fatty-acyl-CoA synthase